MSLGQRVAEGVKFVMNAAQHVLKLALCATPISGYWPAPVASGFVWSGPVGNDPGVAPANYSYNSTRGANTIARLGTGVYRVDFPGLGIEVGGNVQVTAYGGTTNRCKVGSWSSGAGPVVAIVLCHDLAGTLADAMFTASYVRRPFGNGGYVWADQPTSTSYSPSTHYQWNSAGRRNTVERLGVGNYRVTFPGVVVNGGTVEVTAYGSGKEHCKVNRWSLNSVNVRCFAPAGAPADSMFTLNFNDGSPNGTPSYHYAWADQPGSASYTPYGLYQKGHLASQCTSAGTLTMTRHSVGTYTATIPALSATGSNVQVTAYGGDAESCQVTNWGGTRNATHVGVFCHDAFGHAVDSYFTLVYSTNQIVIC